MKSKKSALLLSFTSLLICFAMLVGSTFAWFTDTATTGVNKIQAGNLKIALEKATTFETKYRTKYHEDEFGNVVEEPIYNEPYIEFGGWENAKNSPLNFIRSNAEGNYSVINDNNILWEPGCTFRLQPIRVRNDGNLALKYEVRINGGSGDLELLKAIKFDAHVIYDSVHDDAIFENVISTGIICGGNLKEKDDTATIHITAHMDENAGNEYQGLSLDGIGITVVATQCAYENDSKDNTYDQGATYPVTTAYLLDTYGNDGINMPAGVVITAESAANNVTVTLNNEEAFLYFTQVFDKAAARAAREKALDDGTAERFECESSFNWLNIWHYEGIHVKLTCDVDLQNRMVTPFTACNSFDGKGHTIKNATVVGDGSNSVGFFGNFDVTDVKMDNIHVKADGDQFAGVISGFNSNAISKVTVTNSTVTGGRNTGAIVGNCYVDLENCVVENCVISGQYKVGGLAGYVCREDGNALNICNNTLTNVTVKGENLISGKGGYVIGQVVGNWNARSGGECKGNTVTNVTGADDVIGKVESDVTTPTIK